MYKTGSRIEPKKFSQEHAGENVGIFSSNSHRLTDRRWAQLMMSYGAVSNLSKKQEESEDDVLDEKQFRDLYIPSSPTASP